MAQGVDEESGEDATQFEDPWRTIRRQTDRRRYLKILAPRRTGKEKPRRPSPASGVPRDRHPLLGAPASVIRTPSHVPDQQDVRGYLRHSADLTMRGGNAAGLVYPLAACALAEHYVFRRIGGSSTGAVPAAATAAAELGRGAPDRAGEQPEGTVAPGFAGLAESVAWLAGADLHDGAEPRPGAGGHRLARMLAPAPGARGLYRVAVAALRPGSRLGNTARLAVAAVTVPRGTGRAVLAAGGTALAVAWLLLTWALVEGSRAGAVPGWVTVAAAVGLLVACVAGAGFLGTLVVGAAALRQLHTYAADDGFGLVAGIRVDAERGPLTRFADRWSGVPAPGGAVPPLADWVADRLDDLAGLAAGDERRPLTFGDLWAGSTGELTAAQSARLRLAARHPEHRVVDLTLVATDLSERRPYRFPLPPADRLERTGGARLLFCETCLAEVLPDRVVAHLVKAAPSTDTDHRCPRHEARDLGVLRELPEPWDLPVAFAVRLSCSPPGLFRAVPLCSIELPRRADRHDLWGAELVPAARTAPDEEGDAVARGAVRLHWFADGGVTSNVPVSWFDTLLPRWPTFGIDVEHTPEDAPEEALRLPAQDAGPARRGVRPLRTGGGLAGAVLDSALGWRDATQAELPGFRGRLALVRRTAAERGQGFLLDDRGVLAVALRGFHAGTRLRDRFTGSDDDVPGQTQTDRYRWIRLRMALREYKSMSADIGARLPLYRDLASAYHVPAALGPWFDPPVPPAERDPIWADTVTAVTSLRALSAGGVLDFDVDRGAPPVDPDLRIVPPE